MTAADIDQEHLAGLLGDDRVVGCEVRSYPVAISTDALALSWARQEDAPDGALVVADVELSARGRREVLWQSVGGASLALSVVLRPELPVEGEGLLWLLGSVAAADAVAAVTGLDVACKWPNDLLVDDRRLGLVDVSAQLGPGKVESAILTTRLNVGQEADALPEGLRDPVTSLTAEGSPVARSEMLVGVADSLDRWYAGAAKDLLDAYRQRCATLGRRVRAALLPLGEVEGTAQDVTEAGDLVVDTGGAPQPLAAVTLGRLTEL